MDERCEAKASRLQERGLHQHGFSLEEMLWQGKHIIGFQQASMLVVLESGYIKHTDAQVARHT